MKKAHGLKSKTESLSFIETNDAEMYVVSFNLRSGSHDEIRTMTRKAARVLWKLRVSDGYTKCSPRRTRVEKAQYGGIVAI